MHQFITNYYCLMKIRVIFIATLVICLSWMFGEAMLIRAGGENGK